MTAEWVPLPRPPLGQPLPDGGWRMHPSNPPFIFICAATCLDCGCELTPMNVRGGWVTPWNAQAWEDFWPVPIEVRYLREVEVKHPEWAGGCGGRIAFSQCTDPHEVAMMRYEDEVEQRWRRDEHL